MMRPSEHKAKGQELKANSCILAVIIPWGYHPFPSRTRKLSPAGPIVLYAKVCGRVGRRRIKSKRLHSEMNGAFCISGQVKTSPLVTLIFADLQEEPWTAGALACAREYIWHCRAA